MPVYAQQPMPPIVKAEVSFSPVRGHAPPEVEQLLRDTGWGFAGYSKPSRLKWRRLS